jgi:aminobenzoyl-glutamate utilization protein B
MKFPASVPGIGYHAWPTAVTPTSSIAHKVMVSGAEVLAASMLDLITSPKLLDAARQNFEQDRKDTRYFSLLPADAKPPVDTNKATMDRYVPELSKFYVDAVPRYR